MTDYAAGCQYPRSTVIRLGLAFSSDWPHPPQGSRLSYAYANAGITRRMDVPFSSFHIASAPPVIPANAGTQCCRGIGSKNEQSVRGSKRFYPWVVFGGCPRNYQGP